MILAEHIIEETLDDLIRIKNINILLFYKTYKALPLEIYKEIERLSVSKSFLYKELCAKSREVTDAFHKSIK